jgi:hypothetical protein
LIIEQDKPPLNVPHDRAIQIDMSDLSGTPHASPNTGIWEVAERLKSIDAKRKLSRKKRAEKGKEQPNDDTINSSSFIEVSRL